MGGVIVGIASALTGGSLVGTLAVTTAITYGGGALILGAVASALTPATPDQPKSRRILEQPTSRPDVRHVYGYTLASATPLRPVKIGRIVYGCMILNSRVSDGGGDLQIYVDGRPSEAAPATFGNLSQHTQGDAFDFTSDGLAIIPNAFGGFVGSPDGEDFLRVWIGLGDQTAPPDRILSEAGGNFSTADIGTGITVLWYRFDTGKDSTRLYGRWPNWPRPPQFEVGMRYSLVYDPREVSHDPDDPDTWEWSENQALCLLDAIRSNPVDPWPDSQIILDNFSEAADVADVSVTLANGGSEARYIASGTLRWTQSEMFSQIRPLEAVGAGRLFRAGGKVGYVPGELRESVYTLTDCLEGPVEFRKMAMGRDAPKDLSAKYTRPERDWESAGLPAYAVRAGEGSSDEIDLTFTTSARQARYVQQIEALRLGGQKRFTCTAPPSAFDVLPGSGVTLDLPGLERADGLYSVADCNPALWASEGDEPQGVAMRVPLVLQEEQAAFYAWDTSREIEIVDPLAQLADVAMTVGLASITVTGSVPKGAEYGDIRLYRSDAGLGFFDSSPEGAAVTVGIGAFSETFGDASALNALSDAGFDTGSSWTAGGGWVIASSAATHTPGSASDLSQSVTATGGTDYRLSVTVSGRTAGSVTMRIVGATNADATAIAEDGTHTEVVTAPTSPTDFVLVASSDFDGTVDAAFMVEDTASAITAGAGVFYLVPVTDDGRLGPPSIPFSLHIY